MRYLPLLLLLSSCSLLTPSHTIDAAAAGPLILSVCDQHDESVTRDSSLVEAEKAQALRSTALVRAIIEEAQGVR